MCPSTLFDWRPRFDVTTNFALRRLKMARQVDRTCVQKEII
jgi:hypothetical protein